MGDGGVAFGLGDCRNGGRHTWSPARLIGPAPLMMVYGRYTLRRVSVESAHEWLRIGPVVCVLPMAALAAFMQMALRVHTCYDEETKFLMDPGDEALVPLISGKVKVTMDRLRERGLEGIEWQLGLMKRLD
jgi:cobalamin biosynthesis protein CobD/CbiB